ncbi:UDP-Gal betaGal beta 1,3-galactosyltransferase, polypeptide 6 [Branchiostoma belcheri]|nr:UDP-Gal betaGal beta 1,3-galactosyltransferase, polypeptide 6 [Branchiostoma belcheri]
MLLRLCRRRVPAPAVVILIFILLFFATLYMLNCNMTYEQYKLLEKQKSIRTSGGHSEGGGENRGNQDTVTAKEFEAFLVVLIMTGPKYVEKRNTIRETWFTYGEENILQRFVIGTEALDADAKAALEQENEENGDLLLMPDLQDSYDVLPRKLLLMYKWLNDNVDFKYVLKGDDDTFARIDLIQEELKVKSRERLYWGFFNGRARVKRRGPWQEGEWVLCDYYLPYALGGGYVLSADLVQFVAQNMEWLKMYHSEDVSLGTWLAPLEVRREHDPRFDTEYKSRGCSNQYLVTHKQSEDQMREKHHQLQSSGRLCHTEVQNRMSYTYDWSGPPSKCCTRKEGIP